MSSEEEGSPPLKSKRQIRSCDFCRQRKIRCNNPDANGKCANCVAYGAPCTHIRPRRKRGPKNKTLEEFRQQIATLEAKLRSLSVCALCAQLLQSRPDSDRRSSPSVFQHSTPESSTASTDAGRPPAEEDVSQDELVGRFRQLAVATGGLKGQFFGSSSSFALVSSALAVKEKYLGRPATAARHARRMVYYETPPWEKELYDQQPHYVYPPSDLISSLLELYFTNIHPIIPVLHRPSFERSVADGLYLTDTKFGATLLAALAVASRYSNDPRVLIDGNKLSSGWKFVMQVQIVRSHFEVTIHEVQFYCLATLYWVGTSAPQICWLFLGLGSRFLQHRGEHRRKREGYKSEHELWNRAFWSIFALDRMVCLFLGRPAAIHVEDYDVEPPLEVDDEYWEHGFTQPLGKPSMLSYFASILRLSEILGEALRRLYASKKLKTRMGWTGTEWEQGAVAELDSAMNDFFDSIPPHLRWDPNGPREGVFFDQSAILHGMYYHIQITIHRPFIHKQSPLAGPSLSICTTAARSALHVAAIWRMNRLQCLPFPWLQNSVFVSAVILLLNIFGSKRAGLPIDANRDLAQVGTALDILKFTETWCQPAGRLWELVQELQSLDGSLLGPPPNNGIRYGELGVMQPNRVLSDALPPTSMRSTGNFGPSQNSSRVNEVYAQSFDPGISIEQLLAETTTLDVSASTWTHSPAADGIPDDEIMSMWLAAPTDLTNITPWDVYMEGAEIPWSNPVLEHK